MGACGMNNCEHDHQLVFQQLCAVPESGLRCCRLPSDSTWWTGLRSAEPPQFVWTLSTDAPGSTSASTSDVRSPHKFATEILRQALHACRRCAKLQDQQC